MNKLVKLSAEEIMDQITALPAWEYRDGKLCRDFRFADFVQAFSFMSAVALVAERMDHHPDWSNVYNRVRICLNTHAVDGVSANDFELARQIDGIAERPACEH